MLEQLLAVFAVWLVWNLMVLLVTVPEWFPPVVAVVVALGLELIMDDPWWLSVGVAGAAWFMVIVGDLILVTRDAIRAQVLLRLGRRG